MTDMEGSTSTGTNTQKEWDEALCPICMDHPHNAVLLLCTSYEQGCRPYICDSSYRHSNCLDRFKKNIRSSPVRSSSFSENPDISRMSHHDYTNESFGTTREANENYNLDVNNSGTTSTGILQLIGENDNEDPSRYLNRQGNSNNVEIVGGNLKCPMCRGTVKGWKIAEDARQYLDMKQRSCTSDSCSFLGNYSELRRHARNVHPTIRPAVIDPSRQRAWRHLEHQQEYGDIVSAIRSVMPGAIVLGDYVIENGEGGSGQRENSSGERSGPLLTSFILYQMIRPFAPVSEPRGMSRTWRRYRRPSGSGADAGIGTGSSSSRRNLWGENLLGLQDDDGDWNLAARDMGDNEVPPIPRRRRRFTRSRPDGDLQ
ncbi:hypothetical protein GIB67_006535 [Kingdonia uniflora]|uniref:Uncharacterized protein n=1 Tax=Kingdonia uniflora TaxID=39325 RepID=A0A7J7LEW6_9MAGN|nr:hypothetical protein GIB67_006535 [Kingdonia uniflora]